MKFEIDENLPGELAADLRELGHDAETLETDSVHPRQGHRNLEPYPIEDHAGVVLFRPARSGRRVVLAFIRERLRGLLELDLRDRLTVVGPARIRVR